MTPGEGSSSAYLPHNEVLCHTMPAGMKGKKIDEISVHENSISDKKGSFGKKVKGTFKLKPDDSYIIKVLKKYLRFVGPGLMISVAYMDPGNYSTAVTAGASSKFALLFVIMLSNIIAIFLQSLCIKLGSVTGLDLSRACREYLPKWLNLILWFFAECAIVATDVAEVIGTAIALNILLRIPLPAGVIMTIIDVFFVLMAYRPGSSLKFVRLFEYAVALLVIGVVICFCVELAFIPPVNIRELFRGFAPSKTMFQGSNMKDSLGILGATVMPHSLFLGSGLVQPRLREFDTENGYYKLKENEDKEEAYYQYRPTTKAIKYAMKYSIAEMALTLFSFALFVNAAILIVAAASLYGTEAAKDADLFSIYKLLGQQVSPVAGTIFMLALLFSGQSAGIVCTIAGQIVSEGHLRWKITPWKRRITTRSIAIIPCLAISLSIGKSGLSDALNASQVVLSILLPFLTAPLIYFTSRKKFMRVEVTNDCVQMVQMGNTTPCASNVQEEVDVKYADYSNSWFTMLFAIGIWLLISTLNIYMIATL